MPKLSHMYMIDAYRPLGQLHLTHLAQLSQYLADLFPQLPIHDLSSELWNKLDYARFKHRIRITQLLVLDEVMAKAGVGKNTAYQIIKQLNAELEAMGKLTFRGRVNRRYFEEKLCYNGREA